MYRLCKLWVVYMENDEKPKYRQTTTTVTVYKTSKNSFGINIPAKIVQNMSLKKGEHVEVNIKKIEE